MKKAILIFMLICFILPKPPMAEKPASTAQKQVAFVVEAGRYAWAWAEAQYYTCFAFAEKRAF